MVVYTVTQEANVITWSIKSIACTSQNFNGRTRYQLIVSDFWNWNDSMTKKRYFRHNHLVPAYSCLGYIHRRTVVLKLNN